MVMHEHRRVAGHHIVGLLVAEFDIDGGRWAVAVTCGDVVLGIVGTWGWNSVRNVRFMALQELDVTGGVLHPSHPAYT